MGYLPEAAELVALQQSDRHVRQDAMSGTAEHLRGDHVADVEDAVGVLHQVKSITPTLEEEEL